jgi:hypothetical protein
MPVASVDLLHGIVNGATFISQFTSQEVSPGIEAMVAHAAGQVQPQFAANMGQKPEIRFTTPQVKSILDLVGSTGIYDFSGANTDLHFKVAADQGSRTASASAAHHRFRAAQGFLVLERISAGHRSEAQAQCRIICGYDGTNSPLVYAGSLALAGTPASGEHYVLGECHLNGSEIDGVQDLDMDWGHTVLQIGSSGELYDTFNALLQANPTVTMNALNTGYWSTATLNGLDLSSGSLYLRKLARTGRVADATAEHIKLTLADGLICVDRTSGDGMSPNITTITVKPIASSDTTTAITLSSTAVAITS